MGHCSDHNKKLKGKQKSKEMRRILDLEKENRKLRIRQTFLVQRLEKEEQTRALQIKNVKDNFKIVDEIFERGSDIIKTNNDTLLESTRATNKKIEGLFGIIKFHRIIIFVLVLINLLEFITLFF